LKTIKSYYRVERRQISYLKFILEAYDGIGVLSTVDAEAGIVVLYIAPDCRREVGMIIDDLKKEILIEDMSDKDLQQHLSNLSEAAERGSVKTKR
jgi:hypothetical protein